MYNSSAMRRRASISRLLISLALCALAAGALPAQVPQTELSLNAKRRLFPSVGLGVRGIKGGPDGRYYVLTARAVLVFDAAGSKVEEVPAPPPPGKKADVLKYGEAFDIGDDGRIYVADRGANALRVFTPAGAPVLNVSFPSPTGIVALSGGEFAAATSMAAHLVSVFDMNGTEVRTFGDLVSEVCSSTLGR